jgi:hypothetical protein
MGLFYSLMAEVNVARETYQSAGQSTSQAIALLAGAAKTT